MEIYRYLKDNEISFERVDHPPVYTCDEANRLIPELPGARTKNLFICDRKGRRHFLLVVSDKKQVDLRALSKLIKVSALGMGSPRRLKEHLKIEPGSVSILALINDTESRVEVIIDKLVWESAALLCHPLVNTSTLIVSQEDIRRFLRVSGHKPCIVNVPERELCT